LLPNRILLGFLTGFALLSIWIAVTSSGFLEGDGVTHYRYAVWGFEEPWILVNVWGRPIVKLLHVLPAQIPGELNGLPLGLIAVRLTSLAIALVTALLAWQVAKGVGGSDRPDLAAIFTLASPLIVLHSASELTELPFAMLSIAALLAYQRKWYWLMALLVGLLPATRPEGIGFVLIAVSGLLLHRRWLALPLVLVGPATWATAGWLLTGRPWVADESTMRPMFDWLPAWIAGPIAWLPTNWPYSGESTYDSGPLLKFVGMLPAAVGPAVLPAVLVGGVICGRAFRGFWDDHAGRVRCVIVGIPATVLVVHSLLHWTGSMASSGDVRYLLCIAPFWGLLAAIGFDRMIEAFAWRRVATIAIAMTVVPWVALQGAYPVVPLAMIGDAVEAQEVSAWLDSPEAADLRASHPIVRADHPVALYRLDLSPIATGSHALAAARPPGVLWVWDKVYGQHNADDRLVVRPEVPLEQGWQDITPPEWPEGWRLFSSGAAE
jgi:hypothetical protein